MRRCTKIDKYQVYLQLGNQLICHAYDIFYSSFCKQLQKSHFDFRNPHVFGSFMEFFLEPTTINHSQTLSHESSLDLMDSLPTNDSHNKRAIIFSITGESVTFYQINLFKLRWKFRLWKLGHSSLQVWKSGAKRGSDELTNLWNSHALFANFIFSIEYNYYIIFIFQ